MMGFRILLLSLVALSLPFGGMAETVVARQTVRSKAVLTASDISVLPEDVAGAISDPGLVVGMEARVVLYAGRPIKPEDIGRPALIERNQLVTLVYNQGGLKISTEGRSLARAAAGERVRAMNLASKSTVIGLVDGAGRIIVGNGDPVIAGRGN